MRDKKSYVLNDVYFKLNHENIEAFISHLRKISGKPLKSKFKRQNIFKIYLPQDERGIKLLARCHIQCALEYVEFIKKNIDKEKLRVIVADIIPFVKHLAPNEYTSFIIVSCNVAPSASYFDSAEKLFYTHKIREENQNNYSCDLLVIYAIRLSLEARIKGILGVDSVIGPKAHFIGLSQFLEISKKLKHVEYAKEIDWEEVDWIIKWLNHFMHRQIRPHPWVIHQCITTLKNLINPKKVLTTSNKKILSIYNATVVRDEQKLKNEIERYLKKIDEEIIIHWSSKREILKL